MSRNLLISSQTWPSHAVLSAVLQLPHIARVFVAVNDIEAAAKETPSSPIVTLLKCDGPHAIFAHTGSIDALFYIPVTSSEELRAREMIDIALAHGVQHFVLASIDRGGGVKEGQLTGVRSLDAVSKTEEYLKTQTAGTHMSWTILQRVQYMDNLGDDFSSIAISTLWAGLPAGKKMQLVSLKDVGWFGAQALMEPEKWKGKTVGMAGDELSFEEADRIFHELCGGRIQRTWGFVGAGLKWAISDLRQNFEWLGIVGHGVDVGKCREMHPEMQDFAAWLKSSNKFTKK